MAVDILYNKLLLLLQKGNAKPNVPQFQGNSHKRSN